MPYLCKNSLLVYYIIVAAPSVLFFHELLSPRLRPLDELVDRTVGLALLFAAACLLLSGLTGYTLLLFFLAARLFLELQLLSLRRNNAGRNLSGLARGFGARLPGCGCIRSGAAKEIFGVHFVPHS